MPIYIKSRQVQGVNYVFHNGESYKRTGVTKPLSATTPLSGKEYTKLYVDSCSGAAMGETGIPVGGTTDIDTSTAGEFQLKFEGTDPGDTGELIFRNGSSTCSMILSVNDTGNPVWDATGTGTPSAYEIDKTSLPHTFAYEDCNSNRYEITLAGLGSFIFRTKRTKLALGKASGVVYSALTGADDKVGSLFTDVNNINYDNVGTEALNMGGTDPQNYVSYTIYHTANASVSFDVENPDAINPATQAPGALSANFTTDVDGSVLTMHIGVSGTPIVYSRDSLKCGDRVIGEDADGTEVVLEYRETAVSDKVGIDFPTHKSTFYVYREDYNIKKHNTSCGDDPWVPGPIVPDPVAPVVPGPDPTQPIVHRARVTGGANVYTFTSLSGSNPDFLGDNTTIHLTAGDTLYLHHDSVNSGQHPFVIGNVGGTGIVDPLGETDLEGISNYNSQPAGFINHRILEGTDDVITFKYPHPDDGSVTSDVTFHYQCTNHPSMSGAIVISPAD